MVIKKLKPIRIPISFPPRKPAGSLTVDDLELKNNMISNTFTDKVTSSPKTLEFSVLNQGEYVNLWKGGEIVKYYLDFGDGNTQIFEGYLMKPEPRQTNFPVINVIAEGYGVEAQKLTVTRSFDAPTDIGQMFKILVEENLPNFTTADIDTDTGITAIPSWKNIKLWRIFNDLALKYGQNGYAFYCDKDKGYHFFKKDAKPNTSYFAAYGNNIQGLPKVSEGILNKVNRVIVYGTSTEGFQVFATSQNKGDQTDSFTMDTTIVNTGLTTYGQCKDEADKILASRIQTGKNGTLTLRGEVGISAGDYILISHPFVPVHGNFMVDEIKHTLRNNSFTSTLKFSEVLPITNDLKGILERVAEKEENERSVENQHGMLDSIVETFENNLNGTFTASTTSNSRLVKSGSNDGVWVSGLLDLDYNADQCILNVSGANFEISEFKVSVNNGVSYPDTLTPAILHNLTSSGSKIRLKITLKSDADHLNPSIESVFLGLRG